VRRMVSSRGALCVSKGRAGVPDAPKGNWRGLQIAFDCDSGDGSTEHVQTADGNTYTNFMEAFSPGYLKLLRCEVLDVRSCLKALPKIQ
jgi:hypothetical protein